MAALATLLSALLALALALPASAIPVVSRAYVLPAGAAGAPQDAAQFAAQAGAVVIPGVGSQTVPLLVDPAGGSLVALEGSGFGATVAPGSSCVFVSWSFRVATTQLRCDGMETFLGEGEISGAYVLFWNASLIVFSAPPGRGSKQVSVSVLGSSSSALVPLAFRAPLLSTISPQNGDAEGGAVITVSGRGFGPPPLDTRIASNRIASFPVPLSLAPRLPTAFLVVVFDSFACVALAFDATGIPSGLSIAGLGWPLMNCFQEAISVNWNGTEAAFHLPPGVGAKHNVTLLVADGGTFTSFSNPVSFSYNPPIATNFSPSVVALSSSGTFDVKVFGSGFGDPGFSFGSRPGWTPYMALASVSFGGVKFDVSRVRYPMVAGAASYTALACSLRPSNMQPGWQMPTGWQRFVVNIGGQTQEVENAVCFDNAAATACANPAPASSFAPSPSPASSFAASPSPLGASGDARPQTPSPSGMTTAAITGAAIGAVAAALLCTAVAFAVRRQLNAARARSIASSKFGEVVNADVFVVSPAAART